MNSHIHSGHGVNYLSRKSWRALSADPDRYTLHAYHKRKAVPHTIFVITLIVTFALGWALHDASTKAHLSSQWVQHTHDVLGKISDAEDQLGRVDAAMRAYVGSGDSGFLTERNAALAALDGHIVELTRLVADDPVQRFRAAALRDLVAKRVAIMDDTVKRYETSGTVGSLSALRATQQAGQKILDVIRELERVEQNLLEQRRVQETARYQKTTKLLGIAALLAVLVLVPIYIAFILQSRARAQVERRLYDMADGVPGVVYQYRSWPDGRSRYEFLSSGVEALFGIEREAALSDAGLIANTVCDDDRTAMSVAVESAAQTLSPLEQEFRVKLPAGGVKWVRSAAAPRKQDDGSIIWNGHWADVSEQKRLEHALQEAKITADTASRAKSTFLAVMSHEIRTPLNGVLGMLELLSLTDLDAEQRNTLNVVRESSRSLQRIIDDILDFSKIEAGKLEISTEPASVRAVVEATCNIYSGNASSKGLLLDSSTDARISPALIVDPMRLRQILNNLTSNAIKFTSSGSIRITAELKERKDTTETIVFTVADTGIGMSQQVLAKLFQPFSQGGAATARSFGGTGLGLTISQRLAVMMGGSIEVESEVGKGTCMILTLTLQIADPKDLPAAGSGSQPVASRVPFAPVRSAPSVDAAELEGTLVLLADDHAVNRLLLGRQIRLLGYAAETAENGVEALAKWRSGRFAILITDVNMPEMDGYELARQIRRQEAETGASRTPIIACTANALRGEAETCFEAGMNDYLPKPVQLVELQKKLNQWLPLPEPETSSKVMSPPSSDINCTDADIFDRAALAELAEDPAAEAEVLAEFRRASRNDAAELDKAMERGDFAQVKSMAHRMKGASRMVGLKALAAACEGVEHASHENDLESVKQGWGVLTRELARADECISRHAILTTAQQCKKGK